MAPIAYILFMLANAALFIRPGELVPALGDVQVYLFLITGALIFSIPDLHNQLRLKTLRQQPVNLCVLGVTLMVLISRIAVSDFQNIESAFIGMVKVLLYYLVLVSVLRTPERLRNFLMTTAICATIMIAYSIYDYRNFVDEWMNRPDMVQVIYEENKLPVHERKLMRHTPDRDGYDIYGNEIFFFRLCGLGIFHDPNDVSLLIVATSIISIYFLFDQKLSAARMLWVIPLLIGGIAMYYTYSRGGLLAAGVGMMAWLSTKYGGKVAIVIGCLCAMAVPVALGRAANIDISSGTGQNRIQHWSDGLMAIRNSRAVFGIGEGNYTEVSSHVAHNSWVHAFVELGVIGGTFFFGCFFLTAYTFLLMKRFRFQISHPELQRLFPYVAAILAEWSMGICTLSRCYVPSTYMVVGLGAAFVNLVGFYRSNPRPLVVLNRYVAVVWITCSMALLMGAYVFVRLFVRW
ncbi:MAG: O-antigen ligase family protein [Planctomycetaceae bacterium]